MRPPQALIFAAVLCASTHAAAWTAIGSTWSADALPVTYAINASGAPDSIGDRMLPIIESSFDTWEAVSCSTFRVDAPVATSSTPTPSDHVNVLKFLPAWPAAYGRSTLGLTFTYFSPGTRENSDVDVAFNAQNFSWNETGRDGHADFQSIATHEFGHFLGLDHSTVRSAIMWPSYSSGLARVLSSDDIEGVCALYPSGGAVPDPTDPTVPFGGRCSSSRECESGGGCVVGTSGGAGFCTRACDDDCGCPSGYGCRALADGAARVCLPGMRMCGASDAGIADASVRYDASAARDASTQRDGSASPDAGATFDAGIGVDASTGDELDASAPLEARDARADDAFDYPPTRGGRSPGCAIDDARDAPSSFTMLSLVALGLAFTRRKRTH